MGKSRSKYDEIASDGIWLGGDINVTSVPSAITPADKPVTTSIIAPTELDKLMAPQRKVSDKGYSSQASKSSGFSACHESHPPLPIKVGDSTFQVYGGSCIRPVVKDMDIFVGFDSGMARTSRQYPWHAGVEFLFPIVDMSVPQDMAEFSTMISFLKTEILAGKKVFMGCIGGHGRTGLVLSVLVKELMGISDSITYVRENYCKKAVESNSQIDWLNTHFGITKVAPTKGGGLGISGGWDSWSGSSKKGGHPSYLGSSSTPAQSKKTVPSGTRVTPVYMAGNIHEGNKVTNI